MLKKSILCFSLILLCSVSYADNYTYPPLEVNTVDNTVDTFPWRLSFPNGSLTDTATGTVVSFTNVLNSIYLKLNQTTPQTTVGRFTFPSITVDTNTLFVDSANHRVGIGTTSPNDQFDIHSPSLTNTSIRLTAGTTAWTGYFDFWHGAKESFQFGVQPVVAGTQYDFYVGDVIGSKNKLDIYNNGNTYMEPASGKSVGIGVAAGTALTDTLSVNGTATANRLGLGGAADGNFLLNVASPTILSNTTLGAYIAGDSNTTNNVYLCSNGYYGFNGGNWYKPQAKMTALFGSTGDGSTYYKGFYVYTSPSTTIGNISDFQQLMYCGTKSTTNTEFRVDTQQAGFGGAASTQRLMVVPNSATQIGQVIQGAASQSANLQDWQNSTPTILASITSAGHWLIEGVTSTGATGSGKFVFDTSPVFTTPNIGSATGNVSGSSSSCTGNAATATKLAATKTIGGVAFDGSANIVPQTIQSINEATDTTCFPLFITTAGTQSLQPLNNAGFIYNSNANSLTATTFIGALTGNATTVTTNANLSGHITSVGNTTSLGSFTSAQLSTALGGDLAVVDGGTGTSTGSITGTGALTMTAGAAALGTFRGGASTVESTAGGGASLLAGAAYASATGSAGGNVIITATGANGDGSVARAGGTVAITSGGAKGANVGSAITVDAGNAGTDPATGTVVGKNGGAITITTGDGSSATAADVASTGGVGGQGSLVGGVGGTASVAGTGTNTGGIGGLSRVLGGAGGAASGTTSGANLGGKGGAVTLTSGSGGASTLGSGTLTGGDGGGLNLSAGAGGAGTSAAGVGGDIIFQAAATTAQSQRMCINASGGIGMGLAFPTTPPYGNQGLDVRSATGGFLTLSRNDTSVTAGDTLGEINFWSNDTQTTTNHEAVQIKTTAQNTIATDINPGDLTIAVTGTGVAGALLTHIECKPAAAAQIGFFGAAPVVQQLAATDLGTTLSNLGLRVAGTAYPITTSGAVALTGTLSSSNSLTYTDATAGPTLKRGANGRCGTFIANGVTPVTISNTSVAITDCIIISLNTVGGTVGVQPHVATITASTGFTVVCTALDTSTYNYAIIKSAA